MWTSESCEGIFFFQLLSNVWICVVTNGKSKTCPYNIILRGFFLFLIILRFIFVEKISSSYWQINANSTSHLKVIFCNKRTIQFQCLSSPFFALQASFFGWFMPAGCGRQGARGPWEKRQGTSDKRCRDSAAVAAPCFENNLAVNSGEWLFLPPGRS